MVVPVSASNYLRLPLQLESLLSQETTAQFEVVVADNSGALDAGVCTDRRIRMIDASARRGAAHARNRGAEEAWGDRLLFCDADDRVAPGWIHAHFVALRESTFTVGALRRVRVSDAGVVCDDTGGRPEDYTTCPIRHEGVEVGDSCNMGVQRWAFERVGGFPEKYLRSQDVAFSLLLRRLGIPPTFVSSARVTVSHGGRPVMDEMRVRFQKGRARVMLHRDFRIPQRLPEIIARGLVRILRAARRALRRVGTTQRIAEEVAEWCGICLEMIAGRLQASPASSHRTRWDWRAEEATGPARETDSRRSSSGSAAPRVTRRAAAQSIGAAIVDVIMPTHNGERSIGLAINSLLAQTEQRWHLIVVDDGSTDNTTGILSGIEDDRITVIETMQRGVSAARNSGLLAGRSETVAFLDCDDQASTEWLSELRPTVAAPLVRAQASLVAADGKVRRWKARNSPLLAGTFVVRRDLISAVGGYDEKLAYSENTDLGLRLEEAIRSRELSVQYVEIPLVSVNHDQSRSIKYPPAVLRDSAEVMLEKHRERFSYSSHLEAVYEAIAGYNSLVMGETMRARRHLAQAVRLAPSNLRYWARLLQTYLPAIIRKLDRTLP